MVEAHTGLYDDAGVFVQFVMILFTAAPIVTGLSAIFVRAIPLPMLDLLVEPGEYAITEELNDFLGTKRREKDEVVNAPNIVGWGIRQVATGLGMCFALIWGSKESYLAALGMMCCRIYMDILNELFYTADRRLLLLAGYFTLGPICTAGFIVCANS